MTWKCAYGISAAGCSVGWAQAWLTAALSTHRNEVQTDHGYATYTCGRCVLKNEWSEPVTSRKKMTVFVTNDKIRACRYKLQIWKISIYPCKLIASQYLKTSLLRLVVVITNMIFWYCTRKWVIALWKYVQLSEPVFFKWPMHDVSKSTKWKTNQGILM